MGFSTLAGIIRWHSGPTASKIDARVCSVYSSVKCQEGANKTWAVGVRLQPAWLGRRAGVIPGVGTRDK